MNREKDIIQWANDRGLISKQNEKSQLLKTVEELGEVSRAVLKDDSAAFEDGIGDVLVTLIILCECRNVNINDCLETAWNEIKDRTGKTVNGTFIKNKTLCG